VPLHSGPLVVLDARLAAWLDLATRPYLRQLRRDHVQVPADIADLLNDLARAGGHYRAAATAGGSAEVASAAARSDSDMSTHEAATVLGVSERGVRFLIGTGKLEALKAGRAWRVDRASVIAEAHERQE